MKIKKTFVEKPCEQQYMLLRLETSERGKSFRQRLRRKTSLHAPAVDRKYIQKMSF